MAFHNKNECPDVRWMFLLLRHTNLHVLLLSIVLSPNVDSSFETSFHP